MLDTIKKLLVFSLGLMSASGKRCYLIAIQGSSCSGKSTYAKYLNEQFTKNNIRCQEVNLDNYYLSPGKSVKCLEDYDFDNPAAFNWDSILKTLNDLHSKKKVVRISEYSKDTKACKESETENSFPNVIILEGIYAFNMLNKQKFNLEEYNVLNSHQEIENEYIENPNRWNNFTIKKVLFVMDKGEIRKIRTERASKNGRSDCEDESHARFEKFVWPATQRWVYSENMLSADHEVLKGTHNCEEINKITRELLDSMGYDSLAVDEFTI
ncbi:uridine kinase [Enteropsectra breve]|nr:uridine kinase [Enteropsectra breve]